MIPQGYKHTEIGIIPREWDLKTMKDISWVNQGLQIPISNRFKNPSEKSKVYITIQYLNDGKELEYINDYSSSVVCTKEDVLMTRTGNTGIVVYDVEGVFHNNFFKINYNKKQVDRSYLIYFLKDTKTQKTILEKAGISTIPDLNHNDFYSIQIPIPPLPEQQAIAQALSDADNLITNLEKLIAKKRLIKQGAMQEFYGKLRNVNEFKIVSLGSIGKVYRGLSGKSKEDFTEKSNSRYIPFMNIMSNAVIDTGYFDFVNIKNGELQNKVLKGDLFFNGSSETPEEVGMCSVLLEDIQNLYLNSFCFGFRLSDQEQYDGLYLSYYFRSDAGREIFYSMAQGATRYNLSKSNFNSLQLKIHKSPLKQKEIATILSDMDKEIEILEQKLDKYKSIKQGMMQDLLTGKVRLV
ncbi:MAG: restriction endonuclease subunit S [Bacteroidetes bacterium]|nr:restriction endonuclease subunit S [Bacteroidota bacterium]